MLVCAVAGAHPEFNPITTNRYLKIDLLSASEMRLAYTVMYGDAPAAAARKEADADANGKLDAAETAAMGAKLQALVAGRLSLTIDGKPWVPAFEAPQVGLMGQEVSPSPFSIDVVARVPCPGAGPHEVRIDDQLELSALGETEIRIQESPSTRLEGRENKFLFRGPKRTSLEDRSITFRFAGTQPVVKARTWLRWALAGGALGVLLLAVWLSYRRMKG